METILIADDQEIVRLGIRAFIEDRSQQYHIEEAVTCIEVIRLLSSQPVRYAILEMFLPDGNIFSKVYQLMNIASATNILVHSMNERIYGRRLMQKGVRGFVSKKASVQEFENAIDCLLKGEIYLSAFMKDALFRPPAADVMNSGVDALSDRELEVVEHITKGMTLTDIAHAIQLDVTTISTYRRRAFEKMGVRNVIELKEKFLLYKMQG